MEKYKKEDLINKYMEMTYRCEVIVDGEGGFIVYYPELPGCLTSGETKEEAMRNLKDAKRSWIEAALESNYPIPSPNNDPGVTDDGSEMRDEYDIENLNPRRNPYVDILKGRRKITIKKSSDFE